MRIALITNSFKVSTELWIWRQVNYLSREIGYVGILDNLADREENGIPVLSLVKDNPPFGSNPFFMVRKLKRLEEQYGIDTYYIHYLTNAFQLKEFIQLTDRRVFVHCHGFDITHDLKHHQNPLNYYHSIEYRTFLYQLPNQINFIANSLNTKNYLLNYGVSEEKIKILYFGVPVEGIIPVKPEKPVRILFLGRLVDFKGPDLTIRAFEKACEKGLDGELCIAGDGPLMVTCQLLKSQSKYGERIKISGKVDYETGRILRSESHIFTAHNAIGSLSNQEEAYGVSIIEAMGAGLPVVTGRSGGIQETVVHGETGYLFKPGDVDAHADFLFDLATNHRKREKMGKNALNKVIKDFNLENEKKSFLEALDHNNKKDISFKNVVIIGPYRFHNFGDDLIGAIIAKYLQSKKYKVCIPLLSKKNANWLNTEHSDNPIVSLKKSDYVVIGGGGILADAGIKPDDHYREYALMAATHCGQMGKRITATGIGAGPLTMEKSRLLTRQIAAITEKIGVRDFESIAFLKSLGIHDDKLVVGADIALLSGKYLKFDVNYINRIGIQFDIGSYSDVINANQNSFEIFECVKKYANKNSSNVILISNGNFKSQLVDNSNFNSSQLHYTDLSTFLPVLAGLKAVFTSHLHLAITAYSLKIPCFSIYVREKTRRFYAQINHPERAVDLRYATPEDFHQLIKDINEAQWTESDEERLKFLKKEAMKLLEIL